MVKPSPMELLRSQVAKLVASEPVEGWSRETVALVEASPAVRGARSLRNVVTLQEK